MFTWPPFESTIPTISPISGHYVSFTTETIFYAQSGYFVTIVMIQWSNVFACKSRKVIIFVFRWLLFILDPTSICLVVLPLKPSCLSSCCTAQEWMPSSVAGHCPSSCWEFQVSASRSCCYFGKRQERSWWTGITMAMDRQTGSRGAYCGDYYLSSHPSI